MVAAILNHYASWGIFDDLNTTGSTEVLSCLHDQLDLSYDELKLMQRCLQETLLVMFLCLTTSRFKRMKEEVAHS